MTSTVELYDKAIISRQPNFDERKTRSEFRKVIPNLKTVVVHCFDPRVTGGIPPAVAKALPGQVYPGEVFEFRPSYASEATPMLRKRLCRNAHNKWYLPHSLFSSALRPLPRRNANRRHLACPATAI